MQCLEKLIGELTFELHEERERSQTLRPGEARDGGVDQAEMEQFAWRQHGFRGVWSLPENLELCAATPLQMCNSCFGP